MKMKVFAEFDRTNFAIQRIVNAIKQSAPSKVEFTAKEADADVVILYVFGFKRHTKYHIDRIKKKGQGYAMIQLCLRSTPNPKTQDWLPLWAGAELVWSYYDLPKLCQQDGNKTANFKFYYAPLGVDAAVFHETKMRRRKFVIAGTGTGNRFSQESRHEVIAAAKAVGKNVFQLGFGPRVDNIACSNGMSDEMLAMYYSQCEFVSGLRRVEGFELPVIEGLLCGARPICFDRPDSRHWFGKFAEFIPEKHDITNTLIRLFRLGAQPVSTSKTDYVKTHFNWAKICTGFWHNII